MFPSYRLINQIKRAAGGSVSPKGLERSLKMLEAETPIGALMSTLAAQSFKEVMLDAAKERQEEEVLAWMTVAAAGPLAARRQLAARAVRLVAPHTLVDVLLAKGEFSDDCLAQAEQAPSEDEWGAWLLLSKLRRPEVRSEVHAQPSLSRRFNEARSRRRRSPNTQLRVQLRELGLV